MRLYEVRIHFYIHFTIAGSHARCPTISGNGTSELAVDEDGVFGLGKTDSTCWSALGSAPAFKIYQ